MTTTFVAKQPCSPKSNVRRDVDPRAHTGGVMKDAPVAVEGLGKGVGYSSCAPSGSMGALLRGLGTQLTLGLSTKPGARRHPVILPLGHLNLASQDSSGSPAVEKGPPKPNIVITSPASVASMP